jgi:hypothetical protein
VIDILLHFTCSYFLALILVSVIRPAHLGLALVLALGVCKEIFIDTDISVLDISANLCGVLAFLSTAIQGSYRA